MPFRSGLTFAGRVVHACPRTTVFFFFFDISSAKLLLNWLTGSNQITDVCLYEVTVCVYCVYSIADTDLFTLMRTWTSNPSSRFVEHCPT